MTVPKKVLDSVYGSKPEDWKQHENGGGWIYKTAKVEDSVYLHPTSIYVVLSRTQGTGGFDWYYEKADADAALKQEEKAAEYFTAKGEFYKVGFVEHQTNKRSADAITQEIDYDYLMDYENQLGLNPPEEDEDE